MSLGTEQSCFLEAPMNSSLTPSDDLNLAYRSVYSAVRCTLHRKVQRPMVQRKGWGLHRQEGTSSSDPRSVNLPELAFCSDKWRTPPTYLPALLWEYNSIRIQNFVMVLVFNRWWVSCCNLGISDSQPLVVVNPTPAPGSTLDLAGMVVLLVHYESFACLCWTMNSGLQCLKKTWILIAIIFPLNALKGYVFQEIPEDTRETKVVGNIG